eukprot:scaffold1896_cov331-Prasinococcus_capsulatus_cf.AAC.1
MARHRRRQTARLGASAEQGVALRTGALAASASTQKAAPHSAADRAPQHLLPHGRRDDALKDQPRSNVCPLPGAPGPAAHIRCGPSLAPRGDAHAAEILPPARAPSPPTLGPSGGATSPPRAAHPGTPSPQHPSLARAQGAWVGQGPEGRKEE